MSGRQAAADGCSQTPYRPTRTIYALPVGENVNEKGW